jgi:hypothetical protein
VLLSHPPDYRPDRNHHHYYCITTYIASLTAKMAPDQAEHSAWVETLAGKQVFAYFIKQALSNEKVCRIWRCNYCTYVRAENPSRMKAHLKAYTKFRRSF